MFNDMAGNEHAALRRRRLVIGGAVLAVWAVGVVRLIESGWSPGLGEGPYTYPLGAVLVEIAKITLISLGLYDLLRPMPEAPLLARTARAAGVLAFTLFWMHATPWEVLDLPGYFYVAGCEYMFNAGLLLAALLGQVVIAAVRGLRRPSVPAA
jgi:DMSO/TMAO reductase YedYZ heme-binding membrane subunit